MKLYMVAPKMAGVSSGMKMPKNVLRLEAPATRAASSRLGSMALKAPTMIRNVVVTPRNPSSRTMPQRL